MLKGLEISVIKYSEVKENIEYLRYDAEYYGKEILNLIHNIKAQSHVLIGRNFDVSKLAGFEFTEYFTEKNMQSRDNYIALTSKNIQRECLTLDDYITIDKTIADDKLQRSKILYKDVLLSYTGEYRRSLIMQDSTAEYQLGPNICRLRQNYPEISPYYLSAFLNSKVGQKILDREKTLTAQPTVAMGRLRKIPIPILENAVQLEIERLISEAYSYDQKANELFAKAISKFESIINIDEYKQPCISSSVKTLQNSFINTGRIDSEYYQTKYEVIENSIKFKNQGFWTLKDAMINDSNFMPEASITYHYLELSSIGKSGDIKDCTISTGCELPTRARRIVQEGDVLVSYLEGSLNSCTLITSIYSGFICSNGFYILHQTPLKPEVLLVAVKSKMIQQLLKKGCSGHIMASISKDELKKIPFPKVDDQNQDYIASLVNESYILREKSKKLTIKAQEIIEAIINQF